MGLMLGRPGFVVGHSQRAVEEADEAMSAAAAQVAAQAAEPLWAPHPHQRQSQPQAPPARRPAAPVTLPSGAARVRAAPIVAAAPAMPPAGETALHRAVQQRPALASPTAAATVAVAAPRSNRLAVSPLARRGAAASGRRPPTRTPLADVSIASVITVHGASPGTPAAAGADARLHSPPPQPVFTGRAAAVEAPVPPSQPPQPRDLGRSELEWTLEDAQASFAQFMRILGEPAAASSPALAAATPASRTPSLPRSRRPWTS